MLVLIKAAVSCRCPRCGQGRLFASTYDLCLNATCSACGLNLADNDSGDGPAVFLIFLLGFLLVPTAIVFEVVFEPPLWVHGVVTGGLALGITLGLLKPLKSLVLFLQYRHRPETWR